jgi:TRAP-type C4-dicarboxylate transport system permease small subunit
VYYISVISLMQEKYGSLMFELTACINFVIAIVSACMCVCVCVCLGVFSRCALTLQVSWCEEIYIFDVPVVKE